MNVKWWWWTLAYRRLRGSVIEVYKFNYRLFKVQDTNLLLLHDYETSMTTRGISSKLKKRYCRAQLRASFFLTRELSTCGTVYRMKLCWQQCWNASRGDWTNTDSDSNFQRTMIFLRDGQIHSRIHCQQSMSPHLPNISGTAMMMMMMMIDVNRNYLVLMYSWANRSNSIL